MFTMNSKQLMHSDMHANKPEQRDTSLVTWWLSHYYKLYLEPQMILPAMVMHLSRRLRSFDFCETCMNTEVISLIWLMLWPPFPMIILTVLFGTSSLIYNIQLVVTWAVYFKSTSTANAFQM